MPETPPVRSFQDGVAELEALVRKLEAGDLPLEDALAAFESGIALVRELGKRLDEAESRIEVLTRSAAGALETRSADVPDEETTS